MRASLGLGLGRIAKRLVPRSLLGRSLLIILLPLLILQAVALQIFYGSHLDIVSRRLSGAVAGEVASVLDLMRRFPGRANETWIMQMAHDEYIFDMHIEPGATLQPVKQKPVLGPMDNDLSDGAQPEAHAAVRDGLDLQSAIGADPRAAQ